MQYSITFRLSGGSSEGGKLAKALGLIPKHQRSIGDKILDRHGKLIGLVERNFCSFELPESDVVNDDFDKTLDKFLLRLEQASVLLNEMSLSGATFDLYVIFYHCGNQGEVFRSMTLGLLSKLNINLSIALAKE